MSRELFSREHAADDDLAGALYSRLCPTWKGERCLDTSALLASTCNQDSDTDHVLNLDQIHCRLLEPLLFSSSFLP